MTSKQTEPDLYIIRGAVVVYRGDIQLIDVRMENAVHEADTWRFVWVLIGEFNVDFPDAALERCYSTQCLSFRESGVKLTLFRTLETHKELLPDSYKRWISIV